MKAITLTDADDGSKVVVVFGGNGASLVKSAKDDKGTYCEVFNGNGDIIVTVSETLSYIQSALTQ